MKKKREKLEKNSFAQQKKNINPTQAAVKMYNK